MKKLILSLACAAFFTGCAYVPTTQLPAGQRSALAGATFSVVTHAKINTKVQTMGKTGLFGVLAEPYFLSEGARIAREDNIADPATAITANVVNELQTRFHMQRVDTDRPYSGPGQDTFVKVSAAELLKFYPQGDYLLDVDSAYWWLMYNVFDGYHVIYTSYSRLLSRKTGQPVASHACSFDSNKLQDDQPSYDEMLADNGAKLKEFLAKAATHCSQQFIKALNDQS